VSFSKLRSIIDITSKRKGQRLTSATGMFFSMTFIILLTKNLDAYVFELLPTTTRRHHYIDASKHDDGRRTNGGLRLELSPDLSFETLAGHAEGFSSSYLKELCRNAANCLQWFLYESSREAPQMIMKQ
jgi:hypothetical protein